MNLLPYFLITIGILLRFLPHPPNFAPIAAIALFSGTYLSFRKALIIPVLAMLISDVFIGFYSPFIMVSVYLSFAAAGVIGMWVKNNKNFPNIIGGSLLASTLFFLVTNAAVWAFGTMYVKNLGGLLQSYYMGLPFFRYTLLGDLFYVSLFFGVYETIQVLVRRKLSERKSKVYHGQRV